MDFSELDKLFEIKDIKNKENFWDSPYGDFNEILSDNPKSLELVGGSGVGKTLLALDIISSLQKKDKIVLYVDFDAKFDVEYAKKRNVNVDELFVCQEHNIIKLFQTLSINNYNTLKYIDLIVFEPLLIADKEEHDMLWNGIKSLIKLQSIFNFRILILNQIRNSFNGKVAYKGNLFKYWTEKQIFLYRQKDINDNRVLKSMQILCKDLNPSTKKEKLIEVTI